MGFENSWKPPEFTPEQKAKIKETRKKQGEEVRLHLKQSLEAAMALAKKMPMTDEQVEEMALEDDLAADAEFEEAGKRPPQPFSDEELLFQMKKLGQTKESDFAPKPQVARAARRNRAA